jgi:hypothetical protein
MVSSGVLEPIPYQYHGMTMFKGALMCFCLEDLNTSIDWHEELRLRVGYWTFKVIKGDKEPGVMVHICNPSYLGCESRTVVQGQP